LIGLNNSYKCVILFRTGATPISAVLLRCFNCGLDITGKVGLNNTIVQAGTGQSGTGEVTGGDRSGRDRSGLDRSGLDRSTRDRSGRDKSSRDRSGRDKSSRDRSGFRRPSGGNARLYYVRLEQEKL